MPTYEYACKTCGEHIEIVQSFKDKPLTVCSSCGGPVRKVFGNIGITFKGTGFYRTDSRSEHRGARKAADTKTGAAKATGTEAPAVSNGSGSKSANGAKATAGSSTSSVAAAS